MELQPKRPPGRTDRKAAAYASEIVRLRRGGYTYEAIREALAEVGIELSTSSLRREVRRLRVRMPVASTAPQTAMPRPTNPGSPPSSVLPPRVAAPVGSSRELAEAFFNAHPSNPLLRTKDLP
ncbi:MAG TPA: hypothetical protein PLO41_13955 [Rubrivivax sp.]|nr:hypothetical protein [Rubrivivax sp.]